LSINPVSALTRATMEDICALTETRELIARMMREAQGVADAFGATFRHTKADPPCPRRSILSMAFQESLFTLSVHLL